MGVLSKLTGVVALTTMLASEVKAQAGTCSGVTGKFEPKLGEGYSYSVLATGLNNPRHIVIDSEGNLLVAEAGTQSVTRFVLEDQDDIVCASSNSEVASGSV